MNKKTTSLVLGLTIFILLGWGIYELLYGKFFPYSPFILGFEKIEKENTVFYIQKNCNFNNFEAIDTLLKNVEDFHEMKFKNKPKIFIFRDSLSFIKHSFSKARFCVYYNSRFFISPWALKEAENELIPLDVYTTHELSHSLIFQNIGIIRAAIFPKWLIEGIAVYSSNQFGTSIYPSITDTYSLLKKGNFLKLEYFKTFREEKIQINYSNRIAFFYSEFGCIIDYLVQKYGKDKFISYIKLFEKNSNNKKNFRTIYGIEFEDFISDFKSYVNSYS